MNNDICQGWDRGTIPPVSVQHREREKGGGREIHERQRRRDRGSGERKRKESGREKERQGEKERLLGNTRGWIVTESNGEDQKRQNGTMI